MHHEFAEHFQRNLMELSCDLCGSRGHKRDHCPGQGKYPASASWTSVTHATSRRRGLNVLTLGKKVSKNTDPIKDHRPNGLSVGFARPSWTGRDSVSVGGEVGPPAKLSR